MFCTDAGSRGDASKAMIAESGSARATVALDDTEAALNPHEAEPRGDWSDVGVGLRNVPGAARA